MYHLHSAFVHSCIGTPPPPLEFPLVDVLGVHCCVDWPALVRLGLVPFHREAACRVDDPRVPVSTMLNRPLP